MNGETIEQSIDKDNIVIGRSAKCDVVIPQDGMSRQHCQIELSNGELFITDLGSTNGVLIDGIRIEPHQKTPYQTFLTLSFGAVQSLQIELEEPSGFDRNAAHAAAREHAANSNQTQTRTRQMRSDDKTPPPQNAPKTFRPKVHETTTKAQTMLVNIVVVIILAAAVIWFLQKEDTEVESSVPPIIEEPQQRPDTPPEKPYESF